MRGTSPLVALALALPLAGSGARAQPASEVAGLLIGKAAMGDWRSDAPGVRRRITPADLPAPYASPSAWNGPRIVPRPRSAWPKVPAGFHVEQLAVKLDNPRIVRAAPNGDIFIAETEPGRIRVLRTPEGGTRPDQIEVFASRLNEPFGLAFYPPGSDPQWLYVADTDAVLRFSYRNGDLTARGDPEVVVSDLPRGGHTTRDVVFSPDGKRMFVSVGSGSNDAEKMPRRGAAEIAAWEAGHGLGAAWGRETNRAAVLAFDPDGKNGRIFASGIRNCVGLAVEAKTGELWCSTNERDALGDDLVPDYVTRVRDGAFYGWPWYYLGPIEDPRHAGERPDLRDKVTVPDVLVQSHSASMELAFYDGTQFPPEYRAHAFAAEHGSWNRAKRTGYKIVRVILDDGVPTGEYVDFMTGFVVNDRSVWGRPVGVAVARDGSLLVVEDGNSTLWRIWYDGTD
jgi:glucose/arabinose dehydrogenase